MSTWPNQPNPLPPPGQKPAPQPTPATPTPPPEDEVALYSVNTSIKVEMNGGPMVEDL